MTRKKHKSRKPAEPVEAQGPEELQTERDDLLARLQRVSADYVNYRKRVQREMGEAREFANTELIKSMLGVLDDMERALAAAGAAPETDEALLDGMQLVHEKLLATLGQAGLTPIEHPVGKPFDPEIHSAMMQQPSAEHPPQTVLAELQKGYRLNGRTVRPASVTVSQAQAADAGDETAPSAEQGDPRHADL